MANRFLKGAASSEEGSDEEDKTVVMSAKDKRSGFGLMKRLYKLIRMV